MGVEHSISKRLILTFEEKERVTGTRVFTQAEW